jgi:hypothetical protein
MLPTVLVPTYHLVVIAVTGIVLWLAYRRTRLPAVLAYLFWVVATPLMDGLTTKLVGTLIRAQSGGWGMTMAIIIGLVRNALYTALLIWMIISLVDWGSPGIAFPWQRTKEATVLLPEE